MGANPSGIVAVLPAPLTKAYKAGAVETIGLQGGLKLQTYRNTGRGQEMIMKVLFLSIALGLCLALWGAEPQAGIDHLMAASQMAGAQIYSMLR
jgi:hypothetical protein